MRSSRSHPSALRLLTLVLPFAVISLSSDSSAPSRPWTSVAKRVEDADLVVVGTVATISKDRYEFQRTTDGNDSTSMDRRGYPRPGWYRADLNVDEIVSGRAEAVYERKDGSGGMRLSLWLPGNYRPDPPAVGTGESRFETVREGDRRVWLLTRMAVRVGYKVDLVDGVLPVDSLAYVRRCVEAIESRYANAPPGLPMTGDAWVHSMGSEYLDHIMAAALDRSGNLVIAGRKQGRFCFDTKTLEKGVSSGFYLAKISPSGVVEWFEYRADDGGTVVEGVVVDESGNISIAGTFSGKTDLCGITIESTRQGGDVFVARYDSEGNAVWAQVLRGDHRRASGIVLEPGGDVVVAGTLEGELACGSQHVSSSGFRDVFMAAIGPDGAPRWLKTIGGRKAVSSGAIVGATDGDIVIGGSFHDTESLDRDQVRAVDAEAIVFRCSADGTLRETIRKRDEGNAGVYAMAPMPDGGVVASVWTGRSDGVYRHLYCWDREGRLRWNCSDREGRFRWNVGGTSLAVTAGGEVVYTGGYRLPEEGLPPPYGDVDLFLKCYDASGKPLWSYRDGGMGAERGDHVLVAADGRIVLTGTYAGTTTIGGHILRPYGWDDNFVASFRVPAKSE